MNTKQILKTLALGWILLASINTLTAAFEKITASYLTVSHWVYSSTKDQVNDIYINAIVHGKIARLVDTIDDNAEFNTKRGDNVNTFTKSQIIAPLKGTIESVVRPGNFLLLLHECSNIIPPETLFVQRYIGKVSAKMKEYLHPLSAFIL